MFQLLGQGAKALLKRGSGKLGKVARGAKRTRSTKNKADFDTGKASLTSKLAKLGLVGGGIGAVGSLFGGGGVSGADTGAGVTGDTEAAIKAVDNKKRIEQLEKRVKELEAQVGGFDTSRSLDVLEARRESKAGPLGSSTIPTPASTKKNRDDREKSGLLRDLIAGAIALAVLNREAIGEALGFADEEERETGVTDPSINRPFTQRLRLGLGDKFEAIGDALKRVGTGLTLPSPTVATDAPAAPKAPVADEPPKIPTTTSPKINLPKVISSLDLPVQTVVTAPKVTWDLGKDGKVTWDPRLGRFKAPGGSIVQTNRVVDAIVKGRAIPDKPVAGLADVVQDALDKALQPVRLATPEVPKASAPDEVPKITTPKPDTPSVRPITPGTLSPAARGDLPNVDDVPDISPAEKRALRKSIKRRSLDVVLKAVPALSAAAGAYFTVEKLVVGDYVGASGEAISLFLPSVSGTAVDVTGAIRDVYNAQYGTPEQKYPFDTDPVKNPALFGKRLKFIKSELETTIKRAIKNDRMGAVTTGRNFGADMGIGGKDYGITGVGVYDPYVPISTTPYRTLTDAGISQDVKDKPQVIVVPAPAASTPPPAASTGSQGRRERRAQQQLNSTHSTGYSN